jgi:hypothetical protein
MCPLPSSANRLLFSLSFPLPQNLLLLYERISSVVLVVATVADPVQVGHGMCLLRVQV